MIQSYDLAIIGGGPGGYVAAIRAAQLGFKTVCIDKNPALGGTCLNVGCIPSKTLLNISYKYQEVNETLDQYGIEIPKVSLNLSKVMATKDRVVEDLRKGIQYLFRKNKVDHLVGAARFLDPYTLHVEGNGSLKAKNFIIATGSAPVTLPSFEVDESRIVTSTGALSLPQVPQRLVVMGGGIIGLELGSVWKRLGAQVTVVETSDHIAWSLDHEISKTLQKILETQGLVFKLSTQVTKMTKNPKDLMLSLEKAQGASTESLSSDVVLLAVGRKPYTQGLGLEALGIQCDAKGFIKTHGHFKTSLPHIFAIGDVIEGPMLAHKAQEDGVACVEFLAGQKPNVDYHLVPTVVYTHPEVAAVGLTEEQLRAKAIPYKVGRFPLSANSRARVNKDTEGVIKILSHAHTDEVLGVHMIAPDAGTMIAEAVLAMHYKASSEDIARICHAHPTLSEALKEAALSVDKLAIHI